MDRNNTMGRWWQAKGLEARSFPSLFVQGRILFLHRMEQPAGFFKCAWLPSDVAVPSLDS